MEISPLTSYVYVVTYITQGPLDYLYNMPVPITNSYVNLVENQIYVLISNEWAIENNKKVAFIKQVNTAQSL